MNNYYQVPAKMYSGNNKAEISREINNLQNDQARLDDKLARIFEDVKSKEKEFERIKEEISNKRGSNTRYTNPEQVASTNMQIQSLISKLNAKSGELSRLRSQGVNVERDRDSISKKIGGLRQEQMRNV